MTTQSTNLRIPWERLEEAKTVDDVLRNLSQIVDWAIKAESTIGYFAVLCKRSDIAIRKALNDGKFHDRRRMEQFVVLVAQRYFDALNAYFEPGSSLTLPWEVAFVGHEDSQTTMLQQMMAGLNAHLCYDIGVAAVAIAPDSLDTLEHDFNLINTLLAAQIRDVFAVLDQLSPVLRWSRRVIPGEIGLSKRVLVKFRSAAWHFAIYLALHPDAAREKTVNQEAWAAALGAWYLQPGRWTLFPLLVRFIGKRESRNVAANLQALDVA